MWRDASVILSQNRPKRPVHAHFMQTPLAIKDRIVKDGAAGLRQAISSWKPWIPPGQGQSRQQGGCYIFRGSECIFEHKDKSTGAHVDLDKVVQVATALA
jgi:hypothetical protein